jgi:hypothetical protein
VPRSRPPVARLPFPRHLVAGSNTRAVRLRRLSRPWRFDPLRALWSVSSTHARGVRLPRLPSHTNTGGGWMSRGVGLPAELPVRSIRPGLRAMSPPLGLPCRRSLPVGPPLRRSVQVRGPFLPAGPAPAAPLAKSLLPPPRRTRRSR